MRNKKSEAKIRHKSNGSHFFTPTRAYTHTVPTTSTLSHSKYNLLIFCWITLKREKGKHLKFVYQPDKFVSEAGCVFFFSRLNSIFHEPECTFHGLERIFHGLEHTFHVVEYKSKSTEYILEDGWKQILDWLKTKYVQLYFVIRKRKRHVIFVLFHQVFSKIL